MCLYFWDEAFLCQQISYLCNKGVWSKKRVRYPHEDSFMRTGVLHQIPVLHTKIFHHV